MWTFVTASWWYAMAAWLDRKKDFCLYVANSIEEATPGTSGPSLAEQIEALGPPDPNRQPRAPRVAEELADRYNLDESWQEDDPDPCLKCDDTGVIPDPDPDFDKVCDCPAGDAVPADHRLKKHRIPSEPTTHPAPVDPAPAYMTHNVVRVTLEDGRTKVTGWCQGCNPDNCCGCAHIEDA